MSTCANCGYELEVAADSCPLCGTPIPGDAKRRAVPAGGPNGGDPVSWEDPAVSFPANFLRSYGRIITAPSGFFARVPWNRPLARPLLFYLIVVIVSAFLSLILTALVGVPEGLEDVFSSYELGIEMSGGAIALVTFFATPFILLVALLVNTLVLHLFVAMLARERRSLGATARVICYAIAPYPVSAIPLVGPLASSLWITVLVILGLKQAHRTTVGRAAAAVLIPLAILVGFYMLLIALAVALSLTEPI